MIETGTIDIFTEGLPESWGPVVDVRSPGEFAQGHIPGAVNLPLFNDRDRADVGYCYKHQGREAAVELGLERVGPRLGDLLRQGKAIAPQGRVRLHCWRGGMRSASVAQLLALGGIRVVLLPGGYKAFRQWVRSTLAQPRCLQVVGGMTGTGKTQVLQALGQQGAQVLDLEALAHHRGSTYGGVSLPPQPTTEQFENLMAEVWHRADPQVPLWVEAESRQVGTCRIPQEVFGPMQQAPVWELRRSLADRVALLSMIYGQGDRLQLIAATQRIAKHLGGLCTQQVIRHIEAGEVAPAMELVLGYYDKAYRYDLDRRSAPRYGLEVTGRSPREIAGELLDRVGSC